jgi:hypothetical protein
MKALLTADLDRHAIIDDTPFFNWLKTNDYPYFGEAIRLYLGMGAYRQHPDLNKGALNQYGCIHSKFYWLQYNREYKEKQDAL